MLGTLGTILLFMIPGMIVAALWVFVLGFAGAPGAILAATSKNNLGKAFGWLLCLTGQAYVILCWVAFIVAVTLIRVSKPDTVAWPLWIFAFFLATQPTAMAARDFHQRAKEAGGEKNVVGGGRIQGGVLGLTIIAELVGFFLFAFLPKLMSPLWAWVPYVGYAVDHF